MEKVRIGIIGLGRMGLTHYSIINTHPRVEITAVADTSKLMLEMIQKYIPSLHVYSDYKELLESGDVDGVIVCTPSSLHYEICSLAAAKNVNVFCEKPFTTDPAKAQTLADMFAQKGLVNQVGYVYRFDPVFGRVKSLLEKGVIGELCHVGAQFLSATITKAAPEKGWRSKRENGGGAVFEMGSHVFDILEFFLGEPAKLTGSHLGKVYSENVEDICDANIDYSGEVHADIHVNWSDYTYRKPMLKFDFHGTKGKIQADLYGYKIFLREADPRNGLEQGWASVPMNLIPDPTPFYVRGTSFTNQLYDFADAILGVKATRGCSFAQAAHTQEVIHNIFENDNNA